MSEHNAQAGPSISRLNDAIRQTIQRFGDLYDPLDLPPNTRADMTRLGLPAGFPFPIYRIGENWALTMVPASRWRRVYAPTTRFEDFNPRGTKDQFHLFPLSRSAQTVVLYATFPGIDNLVPGEVVIDPFAEGRREANPTALRVAHVGDMDLVLIEHELAVARFRRDLGLPAETQSESN